MPKFKDSDIVVFEGAITTFSVITCLIDKNHPDIIKANVEEIARYYQRP